MLALPGQSHTFLLFFLISDLAFWNHLFFCSDIRVNLSTEVKNIVHPLNRHYWIGISIFGELPFLKTFVSLYLKGRVTEWETHTHTHTSVCSLPTRPQRHKASSQDLLPGHPHVCRSKELRRLRLCSQAISREQDG